MRLQNPENLCLSRMLYVDNMSIKPTDTWTDVNSITLNPHLPM